MKSWAVLLLVAAAAWFGYTRWVAPDGDGASPPDMRVQDPDATPAESGSSDVDEAREPSSSGAGLDLDLGGDVVGPPVPGAPAPRTDDPRDGPAWKLHEEWIAAREGGATARADELASKIVAEHPHSDPARLVHFEAGRRWYREFRRLGRTEEGLIAAREARKLLTPALFLRSAEAAQKERLIEGLRDCTRAVLFGRRPVEGVLRPYTPERGDVLGALRRRTFKPQWGAEATPEMIAHVSGLRGPEAMRAGDPVLVPLGTVEIVVVKSEFRLYLLLGGAFVRDYPVGLGRESSTPEADFVVDSKIVNPDWWSPDGRKIAHGDPENILGSRWMGFANTAQFSGFGIHGTSRPESIGREESSGCIRMQRADVEELFAWTPHGARVSIRR